MFAYTGITEAIPELNPPTQKIQLPVLERSNCPESNNINNDY